MRVGRDAVFVNLGAEKLLIAEKENRKIAAIRVRRHAWIWNGVSDQSPIGAALQVETGAPDVQTFAFDESPSRYLLEVAPADMDAVTRELSQCTVPVQRLATLDASGALTWSSAGLSERVDTLTTAWRATLDW